MSDNANNRSDMKQICPKCGSEQIAIERRIDGKCYCQKCYHTWPNKRSSELKRYYMEYNGFDECVDEQECDSGRWVEYDDAEAALAERDAEIKRLREALELAYSGVDELMARHEYCDCSDEPTDDICIGCNLKAILEDLRKVYRIYHIGE